MPIGGSWRIYFSFQQTGIHSYRLVLYAILSPCSILLCHYVLLSNIIFKWLSGKFGCRHTTFLAFYSLLPDARPPLHQALICGAILQSWWNGVGCGWGNKFGCGHIWLHTLGLLGWFRANGYNFISCVCCHSWLPVFISNDWWCRGAKAVCKYFVKMMILSN